jgi:hypothetical protein
LNPFGNQVPRYDFNAAALAIRASYWVMLAEATAGIRLATAEPTSY